MKAGYKQTEVGVIPEDWDVATIGEFNPFVTSGSRGWAEYYSNFGDPFIRITNMTRKQISLDLSSLRFVSLPKDSAEGKRTKLQDDDILISITADIGICSYVDESLAKPAYINQHIALVRFENDEIHPKYVNYYLASDPVQRLFVAGSDTGAKAGMNLEGIRSIQFAKPDAAEQKAIAGALSDVDGLIAGLEALIAKKRSLKTATMQQLLTGKTRLPGFGEGLGMKQTELGEIPEDWGIYSIDDLAATPLQNGVFFEGNRKGRGAAMINVGDLYKSSPIAVSSLEKFDASNSEIARFAVKTGDLFFTRSSIVPSGIAYCNWLGDLDEETVVFDSHIVRFNPNREKVVPSYIYSALLMRKSREQLVANAKTATMTTIDQAGISVCKVAVPSIEEQLSISDVLTHFDMSISTLEGRLCKTKALKQGMMQELLTGRTRLI